jgi:hypothetical protein
VCDDHEHDHAGSGGGEISRRSVLQGMVALAALAGFGKTRPASAALPARAPSLNGLDSSYVLGMHLHASTSEGNGSMRAQLAQAALNGFDVAWFTEHDWRRRRLFYRPAYHFLAKDVSMGGAWTLPKMTNTGSLTTTSGGLLVTTPSMVSPNDPGKGALRLRATSKGPAQGSVRYQLKTDPSRTNIRTRIAGRTVSLDVLPTGIGPDAWGELKFTLSRQIAGPGRPAGIVSLLYRLRSDITTKAFTQQGLVGVVDLPVTPGVWQTLALDLTSDVLGVWGDIDPRDNALFGMEFHAVSRRKSPAEIFFSYLRFDNQVDYDAVGTEKSILSGYASAVPVLGLVGSEISFGPHLNQYGGTQDDYQYPSTLTGLNSPVGEIRSSVVTAIHTSLGLASINHPFKPGDSSTVKTPLSVAQDLLSINAGGADILEVGYANRDGAPLSSYLQVWDALSRNGLFLTGNGVSDDHSGIGWSSMTNRFYTAAWSDALEEGHLMASLSRGAAYVGYLGGFGGTLDMAIEPVDIGDAVPMGAVAVNPATSRTLRIGVTGLPDGGGVQVVRGDVDRPGISDPSATSLVLDTLSADRLNTSNEYVIDATQDCFVRLQVVDSYGAVVAFGQPIWMLQSNPGNVPINRLTTS